MREYYVAFGVPFGFFARGNRAFGLKMDKRKQKLIDALAVIIILLLTLPIAVFCMGKNGSTGGSWDCVPRVTPSGTAKPEYAVYKIVYGEKQSINSVCVNFSRFDKNADGNKLMLTFDFTDSESQAKSTSYIPLSRRQAAVENASEKSYFFVKIIENSGEKSAYVRVGVKQNVSINEIVFLDKSKNPLKAEFFGAITWKNDKYDFYYKDELKGVSSAENSVDARYSAGTGENFENPGEKQAELLTAVTSFLKGDGAGVSSTHAPLGVILTSIGTAIFGAGLFGLNFMNYIAFVSTLIIVYFAAKKFFSDYRFGIAAAAILLFAGVPVSAAIGGAASALALPFVVGALLLAYEYLLYPVKNCKKIAVSGILFSLAFAIDVHSIVAFMALAIVCVSGAKREISAFSGYEKLSGLEREYAREKYVKRTVSVIVRAVCCFLFLPFLIQFISYGISFFAYANYYGELGGNLFAIFAKNTAALFSAAASDESLIFGWLIGLGGETSKYYGENAAKISCNPAVIVLGTAAVVFVSSLVCSYGTKKPLTEKAFSENKYQSVTGALVVFVSFVSCFVSLLIFGVYGAYQTFLYAAAVYCFAIPLSFKCLRAINEKTAFYSLSVCSVVVFVFGAIFFTQILQLDFYPSIAQVIFGF